MRYKKNRGFTLVEMIVTTAVAAILIAALFSYLLYNLRMYTIADNEAKIQEECTKIMERLTIMGKESTKIESSTSTWNFYEKDSYNNDAVKEIVTWSNNLLQIDGEKIYNYIEISNFDIVAIGDSLYEIKITGSRKTESKHFTTTISTRN